MGRVSPINVALLLEPITGANPAGEDLRLDPSPTSVYQTLASAQSRARKEEYNALMKGTPRTAALAAWSEAFDLAHGALAEKTRDVHIAVFMLEAAVRKFGLPGLHDSISVLRGLIEKFWDNLYPVADEDGGFERRMSYVRGLDGGEKPGSLIAPMYLVPLITGGGQPDVTMQMYAEEPEGDAVKLAMAAMKPQAATDLAATATACREEFSALRELMLSRCGESAPPTGNIDDALRQIAGAATAIAAKVAPAVDAKEPDMTSDATDQAGAVSSGGPVAIGTIKSRAQALSMLDAVAVFFQRHDPHSFVAYGAAEVARWGRMPLPELLAELLQGNDSAREALSRRLGVLVQEAKRPDG